MAIETAVDKRNQEIELRKKEQAKSAWTLLDKMKPSIAAVLPRHMTPERMAMIAFTAMRRTPRLLECSQESIVGSIMTAAMLGLEPSGPLGHGALIPYWNSKLRAFECQFQPMYQGLLDLARRSGFIKDVQLRAVFKGDKYLYRFGLEPTIEHVPMEGTGADDPNRDCTNVYAIIRLTSGGVQWDQMSFAQAVAHGKRYSPSYDAQKKEFKPDSAWADNPLAMALKTILKIVLKLCPKSPELSAAMQMDDLADMGKTSTMRKMGDDVFDVDFGEEPEENGDRSRGTVDLDSLKPGKEENRGHGQEHLDQVKPKESAADNPVQGGEQRAPQNQQVPPQAAEAKPSEGGTQLDPEAKCTDAQFDILQAAQLEHDVEPKVFIGWVKNVLKYKMVAHLQQKQFDRALAFIKAGGKEEAQ